MKMLICVLFSLAPALALRLRQFAPNDHNLQAQEQEEELQFGADKELIDEYLDSSYAVRYNMSDVDMSALYWDEMPKEKQEICKKEIKEHSINNNCQSAQTYGGEACKNRYRIGNYRLADFLAGRAGARPWMAHYLPNSFAMKYWKSTKKHDKTDFATLYKLVHEDTLVPDKPDRDTVVVHYRGYDVLAWHDHSEYTKSMDQYEKAAMEAKEAGATKAVIMAGDHLGMSPEWKKATQDKLDEITHIFEKQGFSVKQRVDQNADCDFIYASNAKVFVSGGGGFSKIIQTMVDIGGGTVIQRTYGKELEKKVAEAKKHPEGWYDKPGADSWTPTHYQGYYDNDKSHVATSP